MYGFFDTLREVRRLSKLRSRRSPLFEQGKYARIIYWVAGIIGMLYLVILGMLLGMATKGESDGPVLMMALLPLMLIVDFSLRFMTQELPEMQLRPWLLLPVPRLSVVRACLVADVLDLYNQVWLALFIPYAIVSVVVGQPVLTTLYCVLGCQLMMMANSMLWVLLRSLIGRNLLWALLAVAVYGGWFLPMVWSMDTYINMWEMLWQWWLMVPMAVLFFAVVFVFTAITQQRFALEELRDGDKTRDNTKAHNLRLPILERIGATGQYLRLEILSVMRCKTLRQRFFMSMGFVIMFTLLIAYTPIYNTTGERNFWCFYCFMLYGSSSLQQIMGTEGNYISALMVHRENILQLLKAKYIFNVVMLIMPLVLMLPALIAGKFSWLMMLAFMLLTSGPGYMCMFQLAVDNHETVPLNMTVARRQKTSNLKQALWTMGAFLLVPAILVWPTYMLLGATTSYIIASVIGLACTLASPLWLRNIYRRMMLRRYENLEGFYSTIN